MVNKLEYETLSSTNDAGKSLLRDEECAGMLPLVIVANQQTAGRGRGNRRWWTGPGALAFSLLIDLEKIGLPRDRLPGLSPAIADVVAQAIRERLFLLREKNFPSHERVDYDVSVHEPNDVYVDGKKIAGILIESPRPRFAIIGIGVNTNNSMRDVPDEFRGSPFTTLLDLSGEPTDNASFLDALVERLLERLDHSPLFS